MMTEDGTGPARLPDAEEFWRAAREGRFLIKTCRDCRRAHWYPRSICPFCCSVNVEWIEGSGKGRIYSYSAMRRVPGSQVIAYVTLDEGPTMMTNLVECDFGRLRIGGRVQLTFQSKEGWGTLPMFRPTSEDE